MKISKAKAIEGVLLDLDYTPPLAPPGHTTLTAEDWPAIEKALKTAGWKVIRIEMKSP